MQEAVDLDGILIFDAGIPAEETASLIVADKASCFGCRNSKRTEHLSYPIAKICGGAGAQFAASPGPGA